MHVGPETTSEELDLSAAASEQVGPYELIRRLGAGGMAEVHLARAAGIEGFEKLLVLKRILPHLSADRHFVRMFLAEARLAALLDHPNIVQVFDLGFDETEYYFTMEFVYGENLQAILRAARRRGEPLPYEHAITIACGICAGLHYAHERVGFDGKPLGLVHRDVSPTNVMVTYEGCPKIADFGIAKVMNRTDVTQAGMRKGKVPYMSPEQCRAEVLDRRSDVFSLGIILYEATTGQRLFDGENEFGVMNRIVNGDVPVPTSVCNGYPRELERIVMRALCVDSTRRYSSARMMQFDLEQFARDRKLNCTSSALGAYMHRLFAPGPFPWGALMATGEPKAPPSSLATAAEGRALSSASIPGSNPDVTPAAVDPSYLRYSQAQLAELTAAHAKQSTLKGIAIGLGTAATAAVLAVGGLWYATADDSEDAVHTESMPTAGAAVSEAAVPSDEEPAEETPAQEADEEEPSAEAVPDPLDVEAPVDEPDAEQAAASEEEVVVVEESSTDDAQPEQSRRKKSSSRTKHRSKRNSGGKGSKSKVGDLDALLPK